MARTVWKFEIVIGRITSINIPSDDECPPCRPLCVLAALDPATGNPALWIELDPNMPRVERHFIIYGTGHVISEDDTHVGSLIDQSLVWHIYERRRQ